MGERDQEPDSRSGLKQGCQLDILGLCPPRYSQETKDAHGAVILAGITGTPEAFALALRQLATMVHCDLTGELREPHTLVALGKEPRE